MSHCTIEKMGIHYLSEGIKHATTLNKLTLDHCTIKSQSEALEIFSKGVHFSNSLKSLSFCNNHITGISPTWIQNLLTHSMDQGGLIDLDLSGNDLSLLVSSFTLGLRDNHTLLNLILANCKITHEGLSFISNALVISYLYSSDHPISSFIIGRKYLSSITRLVK